MNFVFILLFSHACLLLFFDAETVAKFDKNCS